MRGFLSVLLCLVCAGPVLAQQAVHVPVEQGGRTLQLTAQLYRPASPKPAPAVAIFHGCGGVGVNNTRMAGLLKDWGYVALVVDSFSARGLKDVCGRNWPTQAAAEGRAHDIDAALAWLVKQSFVDGKRLAFMGYSYGGGVAMLRALSPSSDNTAPTPARAAILVYPDCALADPLGAKLTVHQPTLIAMARKHGVAAYVGDGSNRWPAVHTLDAARLFRLALEAAPAGSRLHGVADEGVPFRAIAEAIGRGLGLPAVNITAEDAAPHLGFLAAFAQLDNPTSSTQTQTLLDWRPTHPGLLADLAERHYFELSQGALSER